MEDKYVGLLLAISSSLAIGTSFIITKKGLNDAAAKNAHVENASDNLTYLRNPIWWAGISTLVLGEIANFAAYTFAPPILVTPLGALSVLIGAVLASFFLGEQLGQLGQIGCALCLLGSLIIVVHAPADKEIETVDQILHYAVQPGFVFYSLFVLVFSVVMIYRVSPKYGKRNPLVYISICSLVGSISVMAIKGFGVALKLTLSGKNQFSHPSTYVFAIVVVVCIMVQMNYFNKALDTFSTNVVNPMYYVGFSTATLTASLILFQGFNVDAGNAISLLVGFIVTFLGVHLLNLSRQPEPPVLPESATHSRHHSLLEGGLLNPRVSVSGRSIDESWGGGESYRLAGHGQRSSLYRAQDVTLRGAFGDDDDDENGTSGRLGDLREEDEDEGEDANEMSRLTSAHGNDRSSRLSGGGRRDLKSDRANVTAQHV